MCLNERSLVALPALPDRGMSWVVGHLAPSSKASREAVANVDADCDISAGMVGINVSRQRKALLSMLAARASRLEVSSLLSPGTHARTLHGPQTSGPREKVLHRPASMEERRATAFSSR